MRQISFHHIDAFASQPFAGNPAGVCFLDEWLDDETLQAIAAEINLSETAFLVGADTAKADDVEERYELRWFSPVMEIDLCGHATLAAAHAILENYKTQARRIDFHTKSGELSVKRQGDLLVMDFPARPPAACEPPAGLASILGDSPREVLKARDLLVVFDREEHVRALEPDFAGIASLDCFAVIATAPGSSSDFVSRFFVPAAGIPEDPVTGSAHCTLVPYWSKRLGKKELHAFQVSERGGELFCKDLGSRVSIGGRAVTFMSGTIRI